MASDPAERASSSTNSEGVMYAAELRVISRQLMDHPSWGTIFQHDTSTTEDPVRRLEVRGVSPPVRGATRWSEGRRSDARSPNAYYPATLFHHSSFQHILEQVTIDACRGRIFPPARRVFHAFELTPLDSVKVVIIGQVRYTSQSFKG